MLNHYILYAENRPLLHLRRMVDDPNFDFTKSDYEHQFKEFYIKLERLVEADEECRGKVELFRYHTVTSYATAANMLTSYTKVRVRPTKLSTFCSQFTLFNSIQTRW